MLLVTAQWLPIVSRQSSAPILCWLWKKAQSIGTFAEFRQNVPFLANSVRLLNILDNGWDFRGTSRRIRHLLPILTYRVSATNGKPAPELRGTVSVCNKDLLARTSVENAWD